MEKKKTNIFEVLKMGLVLNRSQIILSYYFIQAIEGIQNIPTSVLIDISFLSSNWDSYLNLIHVIANIQNWGFPRKP